MTSTFAGRICNKREYTSCSGIVKDIRIPNFLTTPEISWGNKNKPKAKGKLEKILKDTILECGLFIHRTVEGLAATPNGILKENGNIVEIECVYKARDCKSLTEAYDNKVDSET